MPGQSHKSKVKEIRDYFEKEYNFVCNENVPIIRKKNNVVKQGNGYVDLCCEGFKSLFCWEVENQKGNAFQSVCKKQ